MQFKNEHNDHLATKYGSWLFSVISMNFGVFLGVGSRYFRGNQVRQRVVTMHWLKQKSFKKTWFIQKGASEFYLYFQIFWTVKWILFCVSLNVCSQFLFMIYFMWPMIFQIVCKCIRKLIRITFVINSMVPDYREVIGDMSCKTAGIII